MTINAANSEHVIRLIADYTADTLADLSGLSNEDLLVYVGKYIRVLDTEIIYYVDLVNSVPTISLAIEDPSYISSPNDMATETTLLLIKTCLDKIDQNTDELEIKADALNLNTDELETKLDELKALLGEGQETPTQYTVLSRIKEITDILTTFDAAFDARDLATETTLAEINTKTGEVSATPTVNTILGRLKDISESVAGTSDSNTKLDSIITELQEIEADVEGFATAFGAEDFATENTLSTAVSALDAISLAVDGLEGFTDNIEPKLDALSAAVTAFKGAFDIRDIATEATLGNVLSELTSLLTAFDAEDFASQTTQAAVLGQLDITLSALRDAIAGSGLNTSNLYEVKTVLDAIETNTSNMSSNDATVNSKLDAINSSINATKTSLDGFRTDFNATDFATETTQASILAKLNLDMQALRDAIAGSGLNTSNLYEVKTALDLIETNTSTLDLNTDQLESYVQQVKTAVETFNTNFNNRNLATETTTNNIKSQIIADNNIFKDLIGEQQVNPTAFTIMSRLKEIRDNINSGNNSGSNTVTRLDDVVKELQDIEADVEAFKAAFDIKDFATTASVNSLLVKLTELDTAFDAEDFATETTQANVLGQLDITLTALGNIIRGTGTHDFTTIKAVLDQIQLNTDGLEVNTDQLEAKLDSVKTSIDAIKTAFDAEDFATETTLAAFKTELKAEMDATQVLIGEVSATPTGNTLLGRLKDVHEAIQSLDATFSGEGFAQEVTLQSLLTKLTELDTAFDAEDFATETTQANVLGQLDITLSALRDAVRGTGTHDFTTIKAVLDQIEANTDGLEVNTDQLETKLDSVKTSIDAIKTAFDARDLATETTLAALKSQQKAESDETQALLQQEFQDSRDLVGEVSATPTEFTVLDRLKKIETGISSISTANDPRLDQVIIELQDIEQDVENFRIDFNAEDFAKNANLISVLNKLVELDNAFDFTMGEVSATPTVNTMLGRLKDIYEAVDGLELSLDNIDLDMEEVETALATVNTSIQTLITDFNATDFATETTQASILAIQEEPTKNTAATIYYAGVSGTESIPVDEQILKINLYSFSGGTVRIGSTNPIITIPVSNAWSFEPTSKLLVDQVEFTGTDSYFIETVKI